MNRQTTQEFNTVLKTKSRQIVFTKHAERRATQRFFNSRMVEDDMLNRTPVMVLEQESGKEGERMFDLYYVQSPGVFHRYVACLNDEIRIITVLRTTKDIQKKVARE